MGSKPNMRSTEVLQTLLGNAHSDAIRGLTSSCPNKLLYVGADGAPAPTPAPTQMPTPAPTPAPTPTPTCHSVCDRPSDCTQFASICSGCSFCDDSPSPSPSPSPNPGTCNNVCDHPSDCSNYEIICGGCSFC